MEKRAQTGLILFLLALMAVPAVADDTSTATVTGTVAAVDISDLTPALEVKDTGGNVTKIVVDRYSTTVTEKGQSKTLNDLKVGQGVTVTVRKKARLGQDIAKSISIEAPPAAAAAAAPATSAATSAPTAAKPAASALRSIEGQSPAAAAAAPATSAATSAPTASALRSTEGQSSAAGSTQKK